MQYFIERDGQRFGPYTLADLQRYTASGNIALTDLCSSEGEPEPVPVSRIIGTIAVPAASYSAAPPVAMAPQFPDPPNLHWGLVLLFGALSCGLFTYVWDVVEAAWLRKIEPESKALYIYLGALILLACIFVASFSATAHHESSPVTSVLQLAYFVVILFARFNFKHWFEQHFNAAEPMGVELSGVMTFFFGGIYFQYHMNDIVRRKQADRLYEMGR
jgi:drug/metabolite transporter (DMT)-like permease